MLCVFRRKLSFLFSRLRWVIKKRVRARVIVRRLRRARRTESLETEVSSIHLRSNSRRHIRVATFNVAMFSLAPVVQNMEETTLLDHVDDNNIISPSPKGILKQSPLHSSAIKKPRVCINLPDNEISLAQSYSFLSMGEGEEDDNEGKENRGSNSMRSPVSELLGDLDADILALQDVKAEEEKRMEPLSDLASALGMKYVFAESWAPEYGNAILSKWPIKKWRVQRIADADDFSSSDPEKSMGVLSDLERSGRLNSEKGNRNVLKVTIEVPWAGEVNVYCTQLDHLDENWRMKQIDAITRGDESPHILLGGLNSLDGSDYSTERWNHIVKYYEDTGKPTSRVEVMRYLKGKGYSDSKESAGECEPVVIIAKGQNVQGTCKYGTRVDYILASPESPYEFVPGSYSVVSSKGTSDHHIVKVDLVITKFRPSGSFKHSRKKAKQKIIRMKANLMS
ncbi:BnaC03g42180D [Brassica napus]|uniref:BnaC03g42180D protein n=1 Tax=Brassica napus TaxID=3708 RepID=A0A078H4W8_BRANA|nr:BnaC03g42180D [Brassica napus]